MDTCDWCGQPIWGDSYVTNNQIDCIGKKYCSDRCSTQAALDSSPFSCKVCGKKILNGYNNYDSSLSYCSAACYNRMNSNNVYISPAPSAPASPANNGATANPSKDAPVSAAPIGSDTKVSLQDSSYNWQSCRGNCTLKVGRIQNESEHGTGPLKLQFWLSDAGKYNGGRISGILMAESEIKGGMGLSTGYGYPDIEVSVPFTGDPATGEYQPVFTVNEKCEDGKWYIVGWANFNNPQKWTFINRAGPQNAAPKGSDTTVTITGASYSYNSNLCTLKADRVQNDASHGTGPLNMSLYFSKAGQFFGGTLDGYHVATISVGNGQGLFKGNGFPNVNKVAPITGKIPSGEYQPVITVTEKCEDGNWYIVGWVNFPNSEKWGAFSKRGEQHQ